MGFSFTSIKESDRINFQKPQQDAVDGGAIDYRMRMTV